MKRDFHNFIKLGPQTVEFGNIVIGPSQLGKLDSAEKKNWTPTLICFNTITKCRLLHWL